jgi:enoyl-[acyl-carrier protein] reductase I
MPPDEKTAGPALPAEAQGAAAAGRGLMAGKRALITGVANDRSIAWAIAERFRAQGAELAFTYQGEVMGKRVRPLVASSAKALVDCDAREREIERVARGTADRLDARPSIAFAPREALRPVVEATSRDAAHRAEVSPLLLGSLAR